MQDITLILFLLAIGVFVLNYLTRREPSIAWICLFTSVCAIASIVSDPTLQDLEAGSLIIIMFYVALMSGVLTMSSRRS